MVDELCVILSGLCLLIGSANEVGAVNSLAELPAAQHVIRQTSKSKTDGEKRARAREIKSDGPVLGVLHDGHVRGGIQSDEPRPRSCGGVGEALGLGCLRKHTQGAAGQAGDLLRGREKKGKCFGSIEDIVGEGGGKLS